MRYTFDRFEVDTALFELRSAGSRVPLEPQAFDVLLCLLRHRDRVVGKQQLMDEVWGGRFVSETAVTSRIKQVRRALGDDGDAQRLIRTQHGRGYRFVGDVTATSEASEAPGQQAPGDGAVGEPHTASTPTDLPRVRYTECDGLDIAYQITGLARPDIVLVPGFLSHLEQDWGDPRHDRFLHRLGRLGRLIRFDKRGTGMSDRPPGVPDLETRMHDVLAVMDAAESRSAYVFGYSEGGPMACLFAAAHPERVRGLVLYGAYAKRTRAPGYDWAQTEEERAAYSRLLSSGWDWEADMLRRCPSADPAMQAWWARRCRAAATPNTVRILMEMNSLVDIRDALPAVRVPTLVVHRIDDQMVKVQDGRYLAAHIPGAQLVELPGADHFVSGDPDQIVDPVEEFIASSPAPGRGGTALAALVAVAGDPGLAGRLEELGGRRRIGPGGRDLLLFDGPATAVRTGLAVLGELPGGRLAVHVGEVDRERPELAGYGAQLVSDLVAGAEAGRIAASSTVRDLLAGSGIELAAAGVVQLGAAGDQLVFSVVA